MRRPLRVLLGGRGLRCLDGMANSRFTIQAVLHLMVDTSTWLDLARDRRGGEGIAAIQDLSDNGLLQLLVNDIVREEFDRNRPRVETSMSASIAERLRLIRKDLVDFGGSDRDELLQILDWMAHQVPLIGALATRNFDAILELLDKGHMLQPSPEEADRVVRRGLEKKAPFHRSRNSVADAMLIELYATAVGQAKGEDDDSFAFVTSNSDDFSDPTGDQRRPHPDFAAMFASEKSTYALGVKGLDGVLRAHFPDEMTDIDAEHLWMFDEPRRLDEVLAAEQEFFDRVWYERSIGRLSRLRAERNISESSDPGEPGRRRLEDKYGVDGLGPYSDFEWGMHHGKLSALRWVLGDEWDMLDT